MKADRYYRKRHPMVLAAAGFVCGIAAADGTGLCWMLLLFALAAGLLVWHQWRDWPVFVAMLLAGVLVLGAAQQEPEILRQNMDQQVVLQGTVTAHEQGKPYLWMKIRAADGIGGTVQLYVGVPEEDAENAYAAGTVLQVTGVLSRPQGQRNPGGFDEAKWLREQGATFKLQAEKIQVLQPPAGLYAVSEWMRCYIRSTLAEQLEAEPCGILLGMLLGDTGQMDAELYRLAQRMGFAHVFAVSGLHVGFVGALLLLILRWLGMDRSVWVLPVLGAALGFYVLLTGFPPSAVRAAGMLLLALLAQRLIRPVVPVDYLAALAVLILLDCPYQLWAAGFQLSFGVTLALLLFVRPLQRHLQWIPVPALRDSVAVVLAAWIGSLPLGAWHFYRVSLFSPVFNLILVPAVSVLVPVTLLALFLYGFIPAAGPLLFAPVRILLPAWIWVIRFCSRIPAGGQWNVGQPGFWAVLFFLLSAGLFYGWLARKEDTNRWAGWTAAAVLLVAVWLAMPKAPVQDELLVMDAGQGSCTILRTTAGEVLVFDGGARTRELTDTLAWYGVNRVDAVILSHSDTDHISGLPLLVETMPVVWLCAEEQQMNRDTMTELHTLLAEQDTTLCAVKDRAELQLRDGVVQMQVYDDRTGNANSVELAAAVRMPWGSAAFPGDLGLEGAEAFVQDQTQITFWLVPHHGSRYSAGDRLYQVLQQKGVQQAVISAGVGNRYGHPHREVLDILQQAGIPLQRTDVQGAVRVRMQK